MVRQRFASVSLVALALLLIPAAALAQSGIAGVVRDTTGAVLPGVTVEASSPVLIEKVRTVVTDNQGQYKIVDLRPGVYVVTFTLPGFSTVRREGIELSGSFTATVNTDMRVGDIQETVTVSGQSPVVDVQNVVQREVISSEIIDALPTGRTNQFMAGLIPGLTMTASQRPSSQDVGGLSGERQSLGIHGGRTGDFTLYLDGLPYNVHNGSGNISGFTLNTGETQEFTYELGAISVENPTGGVRSNMIPKEGGNLFKGSIFANFANESLQSDNVTDDLRARGLRAANAMKRLWDVNPSVGGPLKQDKLWFFGSFRYWGLHDWVAGMWYDLDPYDVVYTPDFSRRAVDDQWNTAEGFRVTSQLTPRNKLNLYLSDQHRCLCNWLVSATRTPEAAGMQRDPRIYVGSASWSSPVTNRLLLEAGTLLIRFDFSRDPHPDAPWELLAPMQELSTGLLFRAAPNYNYTRQFLNNYRTALTYATGSHAFKVGFQLQHGFRRNLVWVNDDINLLLLNGVPRSVTVNATPYTARENENAALGLFAQDQWTIKRLTLNAGVRFDYHNASVPEQHLPPARFVPARDFAAVPDVPSWTDVSPRVGASYDLFGAGKTALKVSLSRYVAGETVSFANRNNPVITSVNSATRTWTDLNGDFVPQEPELGPLSDANFGQVRIRTRFDDAVRKGFGSRGSNWETSASLQHELLPRVSISAAYFRRWYGNFTVTDNLEVTPGDFDPFCITAPADARLPGGGGQQICGLYDIKPALFGRANNFVTFADNFGKQTEVYNGVDFTMDARLPLGAVVSGGLNLGRAVTNRCFVIDSPEELRFCNVSPPLQPQIKFNGIVRLPWNFQAAGTFQSLPGPEITASYVVPNELIRESLGRNLAAGARGTKTVELIEPSTTYAERVYQVDARLAKTVMLGQTSIKGMVDLYNLFNVSPVLVLNTRYGPAWQQPTFILPGRLVKFGVQADF